MVEGSDERSQKPSQDVETPESGEGRFDFQGDIQNVVVVEHLSGGLRFEASGNPRDLRSVPRQLPPEPSHFENHQDILDRLSEHAGNRPQVEVIAGPPGVGKSALAVHWANLVGARFRDGQIYLNLRGAGQGSPLTVAEALSALLGSVGLEPAVLPSDPDQRASLWRSATHDKHLLVLLDNAADADRVAPLLPNGPHTVTLVTSRNALAELADTTDVRVTSLTLLTSDHAVALLRQLIEPVRGPVAESELRELAKLCGHLQLAVRVAARRLVKSPLLTVSGLNDELRGGGRVLGPVRTVFDSAYRDLRPDSARLFRLLGVAPGSELSLECVAALFGRGPASAEMRDGIDDLYSAHLISTGPGHRLLMHDLLQAYAAELADAEANRAEAREALERLGRWYAATASAAATALGSEQVPSTGPVEDVPVFQTGKDAQDWHRLEDTNLALVVEQLTACGLDALSLDLSRAAVELYAFNNSPSWQKVARRGLDLAGLHADVSAQAWFRESLGKMYTQTGELDNALTEHQSALELRRAAGDRSGQTRSLNALGLTFWRRGEVDAAESSLIAAIESARATEDTAFETFALMNLGMVALGRAEKAAPADRPTAYAAALVHLDAAWDRLGGAGGEFYRVNVLYDRAVALAGLGDLEAAEGCAAEAVERARSLSTPLLLASALVSAAKVGSAAGRVERAADALNEAIDLFRSLGAVNRATEAEAELAGLDDPQ